MPGSGPARRTPGPHSVTRTACPHPPGGISRLGQTCSPQTGKHFNVIKKLPKTVQKCPDSIFRDDTCTGCPISSQVDLDF